MKIDPFLGCKSFQKGSFEWDMTIPPFGALKIKPSPSTPKCWDTDRAWTAWISSLGTVITMRSQWKHQSIPSNNLHVCPQNFRQITRFCWWNQKIIGKSQLFQHVWHVSIHIFSDFPRFSGWISPVFPAFPSHPQRFPAIAGASPGDHDIFQGQDVQAPRGDLEAEIQTPVLERLEI